MKARTTVAFSVATASLVAACVVFEDRIAKVTSPELADAAITASCTGGRDFIAAATATLDETAASILMKGVDVACSLRAERTPISATIYDIPLDQFCADTQPLQAREAAQEVQQTFNAGLSKVCEGQE